jgi:uncharacterized membrane protein YeaQ/YmgE (transglycosylase-associated protein family)
LIGKATYDDSNDDIEYGFVPRAVLHGIVGAIAGGILGSRLRTEQWEKVQISGRAPD